MRMETRQTNMVSHTIFIVTSFAVNEVLTQLFHLQQIKLYLQP